MATVSEHYGRPGLERDVLAAVAAAGLDPDALTATDLAPVDEFHLGGLPAMRELLALLDLDGGSRLLDVGSGIGGPARLAAADHGCAVVGVDLTPEFTETATALTARVGLAGLVSFTTADAVALPYDDGAFSAASLVHVGMNMPDKPGVFAEVRRVLAPGAPFVVFDQMRTGDAEPAYPCPWAGSAEQSFLGTVADYRDGLTAAGFVVESEQDRTTEALAFFAAMRAAGPQPLGLHTMFGPQWLERVGNNDAALEAGVLVPVVMLARAA
jgi:SAM-dependent methyltransferase